MKIGHAHLKVRDLERAISFYEAFLGLEVVDKRSLAEAYTKLTDAGVPVSAVDHVISWAIYFPAPEATGWRSTGTLARSPAARGSGRAATFLSRRKSCASPRRAPCDSPVYAARPFADLRPGVRRARGRMGAAKKTRARAVRWSSLAPIAEPKEIPIKLVARIVPR